MAVFVCAGCETPLTTAVSRVAMPAHARQVYGNGQFQLGVLMEAATYAVEPEAIRPGPLKGERGFVIAPGDVRGVRYLADRLDGYCCGIDGRDGPNLACENCGRPVASRVDDCSLWQTIWLDGHAVRRVEGAEAPVLDWPALLAEPPAVAPVDPSGWWDPRWEAAIGAAIARLLIVSEGAPIRVPDGLLADLFQRSLDRLLPPGGGEPLTLRLAGPGRPLTAGRGPRHHSGGGGRWADDLGTAGEVAEDGEVLLVPEHPQSGLVWPVAGRSASLAWDCWHWLASPGELRTDAVPADVWRDDPPAPTPWRLFEPDARVFADVLVVRAEPWLREVGERFRRWPFFF